MMVRCLKERCYSPIACAGFGYCREFNMGRPFLVERIRYAAMRQEYATSRTLGFDASEALAAALDVGADIIDIAGSPMKTEPEFIRRYVIGGGR